MFLTKVKVSASDKGTSFPLHFRFYKFNVFKIMNQKLFFESKGLFTREISQSNFAVQTNRTAHFKKCKQLLEYQHFLLL
jgi:hypothetical protein